MRVVSLPQPAATLTVTRQPCDHPLMTFREDVPTWMECKQGDGHPMVSRWVTFDFACPSEVVGTRIAIAADEDEPEALGVSHFPGAGWMLWLNNDWLPLPLGVVVGSAIVEASYPIEDLSDPDPQTLDCGQVVYRHTPDGPEDFLILTDRFVHPSVDEHIEDQAPYCDWSPGRFAWLLTDAAPCQKRCPWCWGRGALDHDNGIHSVECVVCRRAGFCDPVSWVSSGGRLPEWQTT